MIKYLISLTLFSTLAFAGKSIIDKEYSKMLNETIVKINKQLPIPIDNFTELVNIKSSELELQYSYVLDYKKTLYKDVFKLGSQKDIDEMMKNLKNSMSSKNIKSSCENRFINSYIARGGTVRYIYEGKKEKVKFNTTVALPDCITYKKDMHLTKVTRTSIQEDVVAQKKMLPLVIAPGIVLDKIIFEDRDIGYEVKMDKDIIEKQINRQTLKISKKQLNIILDKFVKKMHISNKQQACTMTQSRIILNADYNLVYRYKWNNNIEFSRIKISKTDCD